MFRFFISACKGCHDFIERNPEWSRNNYYIIDYQPSEEDYEADEIAWREKRKENDITNFRETGQR